MAIKKSQLIIITRLVLMTSPLQWSGSDESWWSWSGRLPLLDDLQGRTPQSAECGL